MQNQYSVIIFKLGDIEYISASPRKWIKEDEKTCLWPKRKIIERKAINSNMSPESDWTTLRNIRIIGHYATLKEALAAEKSRQAASSSSEAESDKRKITKNKKYRDDSLSPPPMLVTAVIEKDSTSKNAGETADMAIEINTGETTDMAIEINTGETTDMAIEINTDNPESNDDAALAQQDSDSVTFETYVKKEFEYIAESLVQLKTFVNYTMRKVDDIEKKMGLFNVNCDKDNADLLFNRLPLKTLNDLEKIEQDIKESSTTKNQLLQYMKYSGGATEKDCVNRCLEKVFTNTLAQYCSWTGRKNNYKLCGMLIMGVIKAAVKENFPSSTDEQFERAIMMWFQHACTRIKRSK